MIEQDDRTAPRPPIPALPPTAPTPRSAQSGAPAWAQWLDDSATAPGDSNAHVRVPLAEDGELYDDDPMAPLMEAARERALQTRRRRQLRNRLIAAGAGAVVLLLVAVGAWVTLTPSGTPTAAPTSEPAAAPVNTPTPAPWCQTSSTADRVSGSSTGDLDTGPGVILHLEYAWYVLRDAAVVRSMLTPDAMAAPEQATRDAISAVPAGTQHCVAIARLTADNWDVTVNELRPDGTQSSWQQVFTTVNREGHVLISSIRSSGG